MTQTKARFRSGFFTPPLLEPLSVSTLPRAQCNQQVARVLTNTCNPTPRDQPLHPSFQDRVVELGALLQRTNTAHTELSKRSSHPLSSNAISFQVRSRARNSYQVVDVSTNQVKQTFETWTEAMGFARTLEARTSMRVVQ